MAVKYHYDIEQGTDAWHQLRCGILTCSEVRLIITPTLKVASNDKERQHLYELLSQRVTSYTEPQYISDSMLRGHVDEIEARQIYNDTYETVTECGFVTNDDHGFMLGYSPDWLVGDNGQGECKSRMGKYQAQTIVEGKCPDDFILQVQSGLIVTKREWCDFTSFCAGMPMVTIRVFPDPVVQDAIIDAAGKFEERLQKKMESYFENIMTMRVVPTERRIEQGEEIVL